jgi:drug/metabolite transporter (DMT)-like permease
MTRLRADLLLLVTAIIWGVAFVAQKTGMNGLGPFGFTGTRFVLSLIVILPFVALEMRGRDKMTRRDLLAAVGLGVLFMTGVALQQNGMLYTSVTNAGFLTGLYVVVVPLAAWALSRIRPPATVWIACVLALGGVWFLNGGHLSALGIGDLLMLGCAVCFGAQVALIGALVKRTRRPLTISAVQYAVCVLVGLSVGFGFEGISAAALHDNWLQIAYTGLLSGGVAYTLQAVAQQYTPASDAAIILAGESLFAALAGAILMGDRLTAMGWSGCALLLGAMLLVEAGVLFRRKITG